MESTAFNHAAYNPLFTIGFNYFTLHGIHCIQSRCMESTAFNQDACSHAAWSTLHSIKMHGIHCIQSGCFGPCCIQSTAFNRDALGLTAWTPLHIIGIHYTTMHGIICIQSGCILPGCMESMHSSRCMDSTAYNRDPLRHNAWNPLHSIRMDFNKLHGNHSVITLHGLRCIQSGSITPQCMESSAFNHAAWNPLHSIM